MQLIQCHIENFGKLSNIDMEFHQGVNVIHEENGWGKSTLAAFLRVMFYGLGKDRKRNLGERDREKYRPWQGGRFGGTIVFSVGEKIYSLERYFGIREKEDIFVLYNQSTGGKSTDYSKNIGQELFSLDEESFRKTVFVSQMDCSTSATDYIHAKIGNISDQMNDMRDYTKAEKAITQEMNRISNKRKTGLLYQMQEECRQLSWELEEMQGAREEIEQHKDRIKTLKEERECLLLQQSESKKIISELQKQEREQGKLEYYQELCKEFSEKEQELELLEEFFGNGIPKEEEILTAMQFQEQYNINEKLLEKSRLTEEEEEIWAKTRKWEQLPDETEVFQYNIRMNEKKEQMEEPKVVYKNEGAFPVLLMIGLVILAIGCVTSFWQPVIGITVFVLGIIVAIAGKKQQDRKVEKREQQDWKRHSKQDASEQEEFQEFFQRFPLDGIKSPQEHMSNLQIIASRISGIQGKIRMIEESEGLMENAQIGIHSFFDKYSILIDEDICAQLKRMLRNLEKYKITAEEYETIEKKKSVFERNNSLPNLFQNNISQYNGENMEQELQEQEKRVEQLLEEIHKSELELEKLYTKVASSKEKEQQFQKLNKKRVDLQKHYEMLEITLGFLRQAKEEFVAKYKNPLEEAYSHYIKIIDDDHCFSIDTSLQIRTKELGQFRELEQMSAGIKDLGGLCLRFAITDVMFRKEKPFLILDDSFINLDDNRMTDAFRLLERAGQSYQVIYFTCHRSRTAPWLNCYQ